MLDAVRGAAVLGILLINIDSLSGYSFTPRQQLDALPLARLDDEIWFIVSWLVEAKFYSLFSFLFGVGFAVFVRRAAARGADAVRLFKRRLAGLLLIGLVHTVLIWFGDILVTYALLGFGLIPFLRRTDRTVLRWAVAMLALPIVVYALVFGAAAVVSSGAGGPPAGRPAILERATHQFREGSYLDIVGANIVYTLANAARRTGLMFFPRVFGMFLLGFCVGRNDIFGDLDAHQILVRRVFIRGCAIGLPFALLGAALEGDGTSVGRLFLELTAKSIAIPTLSLGYTAGLALLFRHVRALTRVFAPAGRMALTNYLTHSIAGVIAFYGIGLGWFGRASLAVAIAGAIAFFVLQMMASRVWLAHAAFGPAEWLWRMFTYRRRFALLK